MSCTPRPAVAVRPGLRGLLLIVALAALPVGPALAADPNPSAAAADPAQNALVFEHSRVSVTAEADGSTVRDLAVEVRVTAEPGLKAFAVLNFTYASANEVLDVSYVRVRKPDGTVIETPAGNIQDMTADITRSAPMYSDIHEKHVAVKGLAVGDLLQYEVRVKSASQVPDQFWFEYTFMKGAIIRDEVLEISVPATMRLKVSSPVARPVTTEHDGRRVYRWVTANTTVEKPAAMVDPGALVPPPSVQVTTFDSWAQVGNWIGGLQKGAVQVTPEIKAKAEELTRGLATDEDRIRALYNFVSLRFHYIGIDYGIGRYQPHPAEEVLGNRYGDCKDKHALFAALLKAAGYDAWPAFVHTMHQTDPDMPSPAQFNHVMTVVSYQGKLVWLDTTPEIAPYGMLIAVVRNKQALVVPGDGTPKLMRVPADAPFPQEVHVEIDGRLAADATFDGHMDWQYRGDIELLVRAAYRATPAAQWQEIAQRMTYASGFGGTVSNLHVSEPDDIDQPFHVSYDYERKDYGGWANGQVSPPMPRFGMGGPTDNEVPKDPLYLGSPTRYVARSRLELPASYTLKPPATVDARESFAEYHAEYAFENGALVTSRVLATKASLVTVAQWDKYRRLRDRMSDDQAIFIDVTDGSAPSAAAPAEPVPSKTDELFQEARAAFDARDMERARDLLDKVIAAEPTRPGAHGALGLILANQRRYDEALAEFRKEQQIQPSDTSTYGLMVGLLVYLDRKEEAIEAARKLLALDPKNHDAALALGNLLAATGKPREGLTVLEDAVRQSPDSPMLQLSLGKAYLTQKDIDRAVPHLRLAGDGAGSGPRSGYILNEAAYCLADNNRELGVARQFAERAVSDVEAQSASLSTLDPSVMQSLAGYWDTLGWIGFRSGDLKLAESYINAAWALNPSADIGLHLGQIYEKQGRKAEATHVYGLAQTLRGTPEGKAELRKRSAKLAGADAAQGAGKPQVPPAEEMRRLRHRQLPNPAKLSGSADFYLVFSPSKVESVRYVRGDENLKALTDRLAAAGYTTVFPAGSKARVLRQVTMSCDPATGCDAVLEPL